MVDFPSGAIRVLLPAAASQMTSRIQSLFQKETVAEKVENEVGCQQHDQKAEKVKVKQKSNGNKMTDDLFKAVRLTQEHEKVIAFILCEMKLF